MWGETVLMYEEMQYLFVLVFDALCIVWCWRGFSGYDFVTIHALEMRLHFSCWPERGVNILVNG
jgi:hypothetical protein